MGPPNAPVRIVDFTDIRCGHCRHLNDEIHKIERLAPADSFSVEARHFPLDSECNPVVRATDGTGVRCAAARALICLEGKPGFWDTHTRLYEESERLTKARVLDLASQGGLARPELERCMASPETAVKLKADIDYAMLFNPEGTPLVLVNGRRATPVGPFLFALIVAGGRVDAPAFAVLPQPSLPGLAP
jgi:serine/threonine-protein kinase